MKKKRGFAAMSPERLHEVSVLGGRSVSKETRPSFADKKLGDAARKAAKKAMPKEKRPFFVNRELAREAQRKGLETRRANAVRKAAQP